VSTVRLGATLRPSAGGAREVEVPGPTLGAVLDALTASHPALRDQLFTSAGELNRFVNLYVNREDARYLQGLETPVGDRDEIQILPAMAGG
jgi:molybdopterin converting factor small subunit